MEVIFVAVVVAMVAVVVGALFNAPFISSLVMMLLIVGIDPPLPSVEQFTLCLHL